MPVNGRAKGATGEIQVAKLAQEWWRQLPLVQQNVEDGGEAEFVRTPMSGGWSTKRVRGNFRTAGDISSTSRSWPFTVEVKRRESWSLAVFVAAGKRGSPVWDWWEQCVKSANEEGGIPMLWMRKNRQPWIVLVPDAIGRRVMGAVKADILWDDSSLVAHHNRVDVHPIGYLADKVLATDPMQWLGLINR